MLIPHQLLVVSLLILSVGAGVTSAQNVEITAPRMHSPEEELASRGLTDLSEASLIAALSHSDPQVRVMAAMKLAQDHPDDAATAIESALSLEQNPKTQIGFSEALWEVHDEHGIGHLRDMCRDSSLSFITLIEVVDAIRVTSSSAGVCAETFFAAMGRAKEPGEIAMGETRLSVIYCDSTPAQARRILTTLRFYLADGKQEAQVRLEASQALADIGTPECAKAIRAAIAQELNPDNRLFLEATQKALERNPHYCDSPRR